MRVMVRDLDMVEVLEAAYRAGQRGPGVVDAPVMQVGEGHPAQAADDRAGDGYRLGDVIAAGVVRIDPAAVNLADGLDQRDVPSFGDGHMVIA